VKRLEKGTREPKVIGLNHGSHVTRDFTRKKCATWAILDTSVADWWRPPHIKKNILLFFRLISYFLENRFVGTALNPAAPANLELPLKIQFVGAADQLSL
jgi:hypothetical protein